MNEQRAVWTGENVKNGGIHCGYLVVHKKEGVISLFEGIFDRTTIVNPGTVYPLQVPRPRNNECRCGKQMRPADAFCTACGQAYVYDGPRRPPPGSRWSGAEMESGKTVTGYPILIVEEFEMAFLQVDQNVVLMQYDTLWPLQVPVSASGLCPNCSMAAETGNRFCPHCGQSILWPDK